ncbi:MAG: DUF4132 domain-containing protein [Actinomycetia bacterium]|nr:DUF4132 domain-containing protein [Actinomycetes bacterium]
MNGNETESLTALEDAAVTRLDDAGQAAWIAVGQTWMTDGDESAPYRTLAAVPAFLDYAHALLDIVAARARAVQSGDVPYAADKLFTVDEGRVIERALATALVVDAPWAASEARALHDLSRAPTTAKTVPSQAACFAMGRAIAAFPTPETIAVLADVARTTSHQGVKKKLGRYLTTARQHLNARPDVALRLDPDSPVGKRELAAWTRSLESCWLVGASWPVQTWLALVHGRPETSAVASRLVWEADGTFTGAPGGFTDAAGRPVGLAVDTTLRLWHPVTASESERAAWRLWLGAQDAPQPFRQVMREHFRPSGVHLDGTIVRGKQWLGLARTEGWQIQYCALVRRVGAITATIQTDQNIYPGIDWDITLGDIAITISGASESDPVVTSELLRSAAMMAAVARTAST